jgi:hypothetical protein
LTKHHPAILSLRHRSRSPRIWSRMCVPADAIQRSRHRSNQSEAILPPHRIGNLIQQPFVRELMSAGNHLSSGSRLTRPSMWRVRFGHRSQRAATKSFKLVHQRFDGVRHRDESSSMNAEDSLIVEGTRKSLKGGHEIRNSRYITMFPAEA